MSAAQSTGRTHWLDEKTDSPLIDEYVKKLGSFLDAMADGRIDASELKAQEDRVVALMKKVEPELDQALHEHVTHLLCELSAYNIMHTIHQFMEARPKTKFRG
jgi:alpha-D-ribose 1-methylphosphonate 5-triphosphate diphosphatase PhnM